MASNRRKYGNVKTLAAIATPLAILVFGVWIGQLTSRDTYTIPIPPTIDVACIPANPMIGYALDPCQEDEVRWWTAIDTRSCVALDELCIDIAEAYK